MPPTAHDPSPRPRSATRATGGAPTPPSRPPPTSPGDEAPPGTPGTGDNVCPHCGGSGRLSSGGSCPTCDGTGVVTTGIGGA